MAYKISDFTDFKKSSIIFVTLLVFVISAIYTDLYGMPIISDNLPTFLWFPLIYMFPSDFPDFFDFPGFQAIFINFPISHDFSRLLQFPLIYQISSDFTDFFDISRFLVISGEFSNFSWLLMITLISCDMHHCEYRKTSNLARHEK